jgi:hypothetical protein
MDGQLLLLTQPCKKPKKEYIRLCWDIGIEQKRGPEESNVHKIEKRRDDCTALS